MNYAEEYVRFIFHSDLSAEIIIAKLGEFPFSGFEETKDALYAYMPSRLMQENLTDRIIASLEGYDVKMDVQTIPWENWNANWEKQFKPVRISECIGIRASFHNPDPSLDYDIVIDPKMAFGTGHHATTSMMLSAMDKLDLKDKAVLDYGCGTGILSIFAAMLGASRILAIDNDFKSVENTEENCRLNAIGNVVVRHGSIDEVTGQWDYILANINREVILGDCQKLRKHLTGRGFILLSGILSQHAGEVERRYKEAGYLKISEKSVDGWTCLSFTLSSL